MPATARKKKTKKRDPKLDPKSKWTDDVIYKAAIWAARGLPDKLIAAQCGIKEGAFHIWRKKYPILQRALNEARDSKHRRLGETFADFVYKRLPSHLQELWDKVNEFEDTPSGHRKLELLLRDQGLRARQHLFLHALVVKGFNVSEASRIMAIPLSTVKRWQAADPDFAELMSEIHDHKKNYYEAALVSACATGEVGAIIFANKTLNRDRGYNEKIEVEVNGNVNHNHSGSIVLTSEDIEQLPLLVRRKLLELCEQKEKVAAEQARIVDADRVVERLSLSQFEDEEDEGD